MYTLRNVENYDHVLAVGDNLTELIAIKLYNEMQWSLQSSIYDEDGYILPRKDIARYMYHLELNRREFSYQSVLDNALIVASTASTASTVDSPDASTVDSSASDSSASQFSFVLASEDDIPALVDCYQLPHKAMILIPTTYDVDKLAPQEMIDGAIDFVSRELANTFGGANIEVSREGRYIANDGRVIAEKCYPINVRIAERNQESDRFITRLAVSVRSTMLQESVYIEIDDIAYFV